MTGKRVSLQTLFTTRDDTCNDSNGSGPGVGHRLDGRLHRQGVQHENALDCRQPDFSGVFDKIDPGSDDAVGSDHLLDILQGHQVPGKPVYQVQVNIHGLARRLHLPHRLGNGEDGPLEEKDYLAGGSDGGRKPREVADSCHHRALLNSGVKIIHPTHSQEAWGRFFCFLCFLAFGQEAKEPSPCFRPVLCTELFRQSPDNSLPLANLRKQSCL